MQPNLPETRSSEFVPPIIIQVPQHTAMQQPQMHAAQRHSDFREVHTPSVTMSPIFHVRHSASSLESQHDLEEECAGSERVYPETNSILSPDGREYGRNSPGASTTSVFGDVATLPADPPSGPGPQVTSEYQSSPLEFSTVRDPSPQMRIRFLRASREEDESDSRSVCSSLPQIRDIMPSPSPSDQAIASDPTPITVIRVPSLHVAHSMSRM